MIVGEAEVVVVPVSPGFEKEMRGQVEGGLSGVSKDAEAAGQDAGAALAGGMRKETGKLAGDLEKDGAKAGEGLSKGASGGLSKLAGLLSNVGVPIGGLQTKLEQAGAASTGMEGSLAGLGGPLAAVAAGSLLAGGYAVHLAMGMETAETSIANAAGTSVEAATKIGNAFLDTAGKSEFSGQEMAGAFAQVAGQLKVTEGHALGVKEAVTVMAAAGDLATAKHLELGSATSSLANVMQVFGLHASQAAHVTDVLFQASNATGVSVEAFAAQIAKMHSKLGETSGSVGELSSLIVDMAHAGISGRAAVGAVSTALSHLAKEANAAVKPAREQKDAYDALDPSLQKLVTAYGKGEVTSKAFKKQTSELTPAQQELVKAYEKATTATEAAQRKQKDLGVTVFDSQGKFVGLGSIIDQLAPRYAKMTEQQRIATSEQLFGAGAAKQMTAVIDQGAAAYEKATGQVEKHGAAQKAADQQSKTLAVEIKTLSATFTDLATKVGTVLIPIVTTFLGVILKLIPITEQVVSFIKAHWMLLPAILAAPITIAIAGFMLLKGRIESIVGSIVSWIVGAWHNVTSETEAVVNNIGNFFARLPGEIGGVVGEIVHWFEGLPGKILSTLASLPGQMLAAGEHIIEGLIGGFEHKAGDLLHKAEDLGGKIVHILSLGAKSPSKIMEHHGRNIVEGYAAGMLAAAPVAHAAASSVAQQIVAFFMGKGLTRAQAAGIAGNAGQESSYDPNAPGGGLFQTIGGRGVPQGSSVSAQLESAWREMIARGEVSGIKRTGSPEEAARFFEQNFERAGIPAMSNRERYARQAYGGGGGGSASVSPAQAAAERKAALDREIAQQKAALDRWVAEMTASEKGKSAEEKAAIKAEIAERKALFASQVAAEKAGLSVRDAREKAEAQKRTADQKDGTKLLNKMLEAIHSGSLKILDKTLEQVHLAGLSRIEKALDADHRSALAKLAGELVKVHKEALEQQAALEAKARQEAAEKAAAEQQKAAEKAAEQQAKDITKDTALYTRQASNQAQAIQDATKVMLDKQAEAGLAGTAEIAAHLQTVYDEVVQSANGEIGQALLEQEKAVGEGAVAEAEAAAHVARVEGAAKIREAEAQSREELAKAQPAGAGAGSTPAAGLSIENLVINGAGMSSAELLHEIGWSLKVGALPVATPTAA